MMGVCFSDLHCLDEMSMLHVGSQQVTGIVHCHLAQVLRELSDLHNETHL